MPNHMHMIVGIDTYGGRDTINRVSTGDKCKQNTGGVTGKNNPMGSNSMSEIIRWFKGRCTYEIRKTNNNENFAWQPRFHDTIIRNENMLYNIHNYIRQNPQKWHYDRNNIHL